MVQYPAIIKESSNYYTGKIRQVLWVVIHRHQQRILEVNSLLSNDVPGDPLGTGQQADWEQFKNCLSQDPGREAARRLYSMLFEVDFKVI